MKTKTDKMNLIYLCMKFSFLKYNLLYNLYKCKDTKKNEDLRLMNINIEEFL